MTGPEFDVLVFGATSFVGKLVCRYLSERHGTAGALKWAAAARSQAKLEALRGELGPAAAGLALLVADAGDESSLRSMCSRARIIVSTVGPYALYGEPLVKVCAQTGTDYCDLTGEVQWIRRMIERYEPAAQASRGAHCALLRLRLDPLGPRRDVPAAGGAAPLRRALQLRENARESDARRRLRQHVASLLNVVREAAANPALRKELANPYSLCGAAAGTGVRRAERERGMWDQDFGAWCAPFVMAAINAPASCAAPTRCRRSPGARTSATTRRCLPGAAPAAASPRSASPRGWPVSSSARRCRRRARVERFVLPAPGEGPSRRRSAQAFSTCASSAPPPTARSCAPRSPETAIRVTARLRKCSAKPEPASRWMCQNPRLAASGRPATALGNALLARLKANAGLNFELLES